jgi:hypothetical protein
MELIPCYVFALLSRYLSETTRGGEILLFHCFGGKFSLYAN